MLSQGLRFLLLRFLPRRVLPILTAIEILRVVQRLRRRGPEPVAPRRIVTVDEVRRRGDRPPKSHRIADF